LRFQSILLLFVLKKKPFGLEAEIFLAFYFSLYRESNESENEAIAEGASVSLVTVS